MRDPEMLQLSQPRALTVPEVEQVYYQVPFPRKFDALCQVLDARQPERAMVFCATKRMVDEVVEAAAGAGLHGRRASRRHHAVGPGEGAALVSRRDGPKS